jgi:hypothetical protein
MDADFAPAKDATKHGWEDGHGGRRVEDCRNSKPKQGHIFLHLTGANKQYTARQIVLMDSISS